VEGADGWKAEAEADPVLSYPTDEVEDPASSVTPLQPGAGSPQLSPRFEKGHPVARTQQHVAVDGESNATPPKANVAAVQPSPFSKKEELLPASSDDAVRDADFVELVQLPEPSPAELSAAAVTVAVIGALIDMVDVVDTDT